jgi:hypothetical protein
LELFTCRKKILRQIYPAEMITSQSEAGYVLFRVCVCVCVCVCVNVVSTLATKADARDGHEEEHINSDKKYCTWTCATHGNVHSGYRRLFDESFLVCPADVLAIFRLLPYSPQTIPFHPRYRLCDALLQFHGGLCVSKGRISRPL